MKVPYMLVVGEEEMKAGKVSLRVRDGSQQKNIAAGGVRRAGEGQDRAPRARSCDNSSRSTRKCRHLTLLSSACAPSIC